MSERLCDRDDLAPLAARIRRVPLAHVPERGREACERLGLAAGPAADLVTGAAGSSPFLADLVRREAEWLADALERPPETVFAELWEGLPEEGGVTAVLSALRRAKGRVALLTALADLGGVWSLEEVTRALTEFADAAVWRLADALTSAEAARRHLPGLEAGARAADAGLVVFAMGKMGAHELNYSSDIDLIALFDESRYAPSDWAEARSALVRVVRRLARMLAERSAEGYVFRTDLRLRPDPASTPVCMSMEAAERYYEALGRTWERAAWIKGRPAAGDLEAGARFLERLTPFVWRRYLDFAAIEEAHAMRLRIRAHRGIGGPLRLDGHDLKLGLGGIREIEFFAQTHQLIFGGREPLLRRRATVEALAALAEAGHVGREDAAWLAEAYRAHRGIEHRLQMVADAQTHRLPRDEEGWRRLACLCGEGDPLRLRRALAERLEAVHARIEGFFARSEADGTDLPPPHEIEARFGPGAPETVERWARYAVMRSERARRSFRRIGRRLLERLAEAANPPGALAAFDAFLGGLPAGAQLFALFEA
ncbi:MAG: glutamine-synthetase adenylyltransferase, partial [Alphaproteobacteria bacterium]